MSGRFQRVIVSVNEGLGFYNLLYVDFLYYFLTNP